MQTTSEPAAAKVDALTQVVVYGTLRTGHHNSGIWDGRADSELVLVQGFRLVTNGGFPYALRDPEQVIVGELIRPHDGHWFEVIARMDRLEGVDHDHYQRILVTADTESGPQMAWMYIATESTAAYAHNLHPVPDNDWEMWRRG